MTKRVIIALLAVALLATAIPALAQANTATVKGKVVDEKSQPLPNATVRFTASDGAKFDVKTDPQGEYEKTGVPAGQYMIELMVDGQKRWAGQAAINPGQTATLNVDLAAAAAVAKMTPEERKKAEEEREHAVAEHAKIKNLNAMLAQAEPMLKSGNYDGALAIYQQAVHADPTKDLLWAKLGLAYLGKTVQTKDQAEINNFATQAADAFQKAININPKVSAYYNNLGQAYAREGKSEDALKQFQAAAQMDPTAAASYYFNAGATLTNQATKLTPGSPEHKKMLDDANEAFRKSAAADPKFRDGEAYYQLATNLLAQATMAPDGKTMVVPEGTQDAYKKYLQEAPNGKYAESAKQTLAALSTTVETGYKARGGKKK